MDLFAHEKVPFALSLPKPVESDSRRKEVEGGSVTRLGCDRLSPNGGQKLIFPHPRAVSPIGGLFPILP